MRSTGPPPTGANAARFTLPDGSRSVQSVWVWRGFLFMSLIAFGLFLTLLAGRQPLYAAAWAVIAISWFAVAMWLWRKHLRYDDSVHGLDRRGRQP